MLSKFGYENFNDNHITLFSPSFGLDERPFDKIWLTFMWIVGQGWGFDKKYEFYISDYKECTPFAQGIPSESLIYAFNERYGEWAKMGFAGNVMAWFEFPRTDWEFEEWIVEDPRLQRVWIHLYNQVFAGPGWRKDLFTEHMGRDCQIRNLHKDTGWFVSGYAWGVKEKGMWRRGDYIPHYLTGPTSKGIHRAKKFKGKILDK